jgi:hypothetical protein
LDGLYNDNACASPEEMEGLFTERVCSVMLGLEATPKVAGVTNEDNGMHLEESQLGLCYKPPHGKIADRPKYYHDCRDGRKTDKEGWIQKSKYGTVNGKCGIDGASVNGALPALLP